MKFSIVATALFTLGTSALPTLSKRNVTAPFAIQLETSGLYNGSYLTPATINATYSELVPSTTPDKHFSFNLTQSSGPNLGSLLYTFPNYTLNASLGDRVVERYAQYPIYFNSNTSAPTTPTSPLTVFQITDGYLRIVLSYAAGFFICNETLSNGTVTSQLQWNNYGAIKVNFTGCASTQLKVVY